MPPPTDGGRGNHETDPQRPQTLAAPGGCLRRLLQDAGTRPGACSVPTEGQDRQADRLPIADCRCMCMMEAILMPVVGNPDHLFTVITIR